MKNKKSLGQHWLYNRAILNEIADLAAFGTPSAAPESPANHKAAETQLPQVCLEIGPGLGTLTSSLLRRFEKVIAVEFDPDLAHKLPASFPGKNLEVICADILHTDFAQLIPGPFVVAGNIPYYITSPIVKHILEASHRPERAVLLMQKEVAERLAAEPGEYSPLGLYAQNLAAVELGPVVPAAEFTPPPKVDSQVLILEPYAEPVVNPSSLGLAKIGFSAPRKKLCSNLAAGTGVGREDWRILLAENKINPDARAEDLSLYDWEALARKLPQ